MTAAADPPNIPEMNSPVPATVADTNEMLDAVERIGMSVAQQIIVLLMGATALDLSLVESIAVVVLVGVANLVLVLATVWVPVIRSWWLDTLYRIARTFAVSAAAQYATVQALDDVDLAFNQGVAVAAAMAALATLKAIVARRRPPGVTPASLVTPRGEVAA